MGLLDLFRGGPLPRLPWVPAKPGRISLPAVRLPRDERPHDRSVEWWHFMGYVAPEKKGSTAKTVEYDETKRTSFVLTILKGQVQGLSCLVGVAILIDHAKKTYSLSKEIAPLDSGYFEPEDGKAICFHFGPRGPARRGPPEAFSVRGGMGKYTLDIDTDQQLALELSQEAPAVFLEKDGVFHYRALAPHERNALRELKEKLEYGIALLYKFDNEPPASPEEDSKRKRDMQSILDRAHEILELYPRVLFEEPELFATGANVLVSAYHALEKETDEVSLKLKKSMLTVRLKLERAALAPREVTNSLNEELAYYLWPGMLAMGTQGVGVDETRVGGRAWMEHQWGDLAIGDYRWRYLAIIVEENCDEACPIAASKFAGQWLFFEFGPRRGMKPVRHAYHVDTKGQVQMLHGVIRFEDSEPTKDGFPLVKAIELIELRFERAADELGPSPVQESLPSKAFHAKFHITPVRNDQVCRTNLPEGLLPVFWEGACEVKIEDMSAKDRREDIVDAWAVMEIAGYP